MRRIKKYLLLLSSGALLLAGCSGSHEATSRQELEREFQTEFGFSPSTNIELRCKIVQVGDTWGKWMRFTYDSSTIQRIIGAGFTNASSTELNNPSQLWSQELNEHNPNAPGWWQTPSNSLVRVYYKQGNQRDNPWFTYLWVDDINKAVYVKFAAWR